MSNLGNIERNVVPDFGLNADSVCADEAKRRRDELHVVADRAHHVETGTVLKLYFFADKFLINLKNIKFQN